MAELTLSTMGEGYTRVVNWVLNLGEPVSPRGMKTTELRHAQVKLSDPTHGLSWREGFNDRVWVAEGLQLIGGVSHPELMVSITKNFKQFQDGGSYHGAYGPRLREQLPFVERTLESDRDSRQAVATIWDPMRDLQRLDDVKDLPCTVAFQFMVRNGKLELSTRMRSNDLLWGTPHDFGQFTMLQVAMARALGVEPGLYVHSVGSLHAYERDRDRLVAIEPVKPRRTPVVGLPGEDWLRVAWKARKLLLNENLPDGEESGDETWLRWTLHGIRHG